MKKYIIAFTLVELIVVITIVGILSTVGFVSYSGYLTGARDSNRISQLTKISDSLQVYSASKSLPVPDNNINITASGTVIAYQGEVGVDVLETIDYTNGGQDPKDETYYSYYLSKDRNSLQLMALMEEQFSSVKVNPTYTYALEYSERYPKVYGKKIGILVSAEDDTLNTPAHLISGNSSVGYLDIARDPLFYQSIFGNDSDSYTANAYTLWGLSATRLGEKAPSKCPDGFVGVPGNAEFHPSGFCVAQYEMTYEDADTPNSTGGGNDWNTVSYVSGKSIVSMEGKYPIVDITQEEAIQACESMGNGFHLITNNEWMTIARSIEARRENWSGGDISDGVIYNGVSWDTSLGCGRTGGNTETRFYATRTGAGSSSCNDRRSHTLTNGSVIWDLAGNVYEQVNKANTLDGSEYNLGQTTIAGSSNSNGWDDDGIYNLSDMEKYGAATLSGVNKGLGNVTQTNGVPANVFYRGAAASHVQNTGIYTLLLGFDYTSSNRDVGFRCAK